MHRSSIIILTALIVIAIVILIPTANHTANATTFRQTDPYPYPAPNQEAELMMSESNSVLVMPSLIKLRVPDYTVSYYIESEKPEKMKKLGCKNREDEREGNIFLLFGHPRPNYEVQFVGDAAQKISVNIIPELIESFAEGYYFGCDTNQNDGIDDQIPPQITIAITTNNSKKLTTKGWEDNDSLTYAYGEKWAQTVALARQKISRYASTISIFGGYDAEFDTRQFNSARTYDFAKGYSSIAGSRYFLLSDCADCPRGAKPWSDPEKIAMERFTFLKSTTAVEQVIPMLYYSDYIFEWYNLRRYSVERNRNIYLSGLATSCASGKALYRDSTGRIIREDQCILNDRSYWREVPTDPVAEYLSPYQAWEGMFEMLRSPTTLEGTTAPEVIKQPSLPYVTDIRYPPCDLWDYPPDYCR